MLEARRGRGAHLRSECDPEILVVAERRLWLRLRRLAAEAFLVDKVR